MANDILGAIREDRHSQDQTPSPTAGAPSAGQLIGKEAKNQPTHDVEATQATDKAVPDASGDKSTPVVDTAPREETTPAKTLPEPELGKDPAPSPPTNASPPPPVPEKDTTDTNKPTPTPEETPASPPQTAEPAPTKVEDANKMEEPSAQPAEPEAPATENADNSKLDTVEEGPKPQSGVEGDDLAADEGSATQEGDGMADGPIKLTLQTDRVRELSTASMMSSSSSTPGTPNEEVASSAIEEEGGGGQVGTLTKNQKKRNRKKNKNKGEKNSPRPPSGETVSNADNSAVQDRNPPLVATPAPVDIPSGEGEGELVEKVASSEEDTPVMVDKVDGVGEDPAVIVERPVGKSVDGDSGSDEWLDWQ